MQSKWFDSLAAIDNFMRVLQDANLNAHTILTTFCSHDLMLTHRDQSLRDWKPLSSDPIGSHWGGTPLYDAINAMGRRLRYLDPKRASVLIVTDGEEGGSKTTLDQAKSILDWMRAKGWQVTFIGCDFNNQSQAKLLGSAHGSSIGVAQGQLTNAAKSLGKKRVVYGNTGTPMHFTDGEQQTFGGYLNAPESRHD